MADSSASSSVMLKFVILGSSSVGKTSLLNRFVDKKFSSQYKATIGADFKKKELVVNVGGRQRTAFLQIWDTAGQERFQALGQAFYRGADVCVLVYDITRADSFESLSTWRDEFLMQAQPANEEDFPFLVIGNKLDLQQDRTVPTSRAQSWCKHVGIKTFYECSAADDSNVQKAFEDITAKAIARGQSQASAVRYNPVSVSQDNNTSSSNCQC